MYLKICNLRKSKFYQIFKRKLNFGTLLPEKDNFADIFLGFGLTLPSMVGTGSGESKPFFSCIDHLECTLYRGKH